MEVDTDRVQRKSQEKLFTLPDVMYSTTSGCSMYAEIPIWSYSIVITSPWILPSSRNNKQSLQIG